jgi:hypothetical protein
VTIPVDPVTGLPFIAPPVAPVPSQPGVLPTSSIQVYRLADPGVVTRNADTIRKALFPNAGSGQEMQVHPASGALWFDTGQRGGGSEPPSDVDARQVALAFLGDARRRLAGTASLAGLLPDELRVMDTKQVGSPWPGRGGSTVCRFVRMLRPSATEELVPVLGETVEVWVDAGRTVQAFGSTCRALDSDVPTGRLPSPSASSDAADGDTMQLIYLSGDEDDERDTTCPFWIQWDDDDATVAPASVQSMLVAILPTPMSGSMGMEASVTGGSGKFGYRWLAWSPTTPAEFVQLGSGASTQVGPGVWDVALRVSDIGTGVSEKVVLRVVCANG